MFVMVHELSNSAVAKMTRINTVAFKDEYAFAFFGALICVNAQFC